MKIILASKSPRRREILTQMGMKFEIVPSEGEEVITSSIPARVVEELSCQKAEEVSERVKTMYQGEDILIIGSDTVVAQCGKILGKPADEEDAKHMLNELQGNEHSVFTGVTLIYIASSGEKEVKTFSEETKVTFYSMSEEEIEDYVRTGEPLDKAGAYGIQGKAFTYIKGIQGDYYNVVGLPAARIYQELKKNNWT